MPIYFILYSMLVIGPVAAITAIVLVALKRFPNVSASFGSKRFSFTLNVSERHSASAPPYCASGMPDQSSAALPPQIGSRILGSPPGDLP
jgi:hypothetical protein